MSLLSIISFFSGGLKLLTSGDTVLQDEITIDYTTNKEAAVYAVAVANGSTAPSKLQISLGLDYTNNPALSFDFDLASTGGTINLSGLLPETDYDVYLVAKIGTKYSNKVSYIMLSTTVGDGLTYLLANARAGWEFGGIVGEENDAITSRTDVTGNGYDLDDFGGTLTPKISYIQKSIGNTVSCLKGNTASTIKDAMTTILAGENLCKNSFEVHTLIALNDGQALQYLYGTSDGGTRYFDVKTTATGFIEIRYAANASGLSTWRASDNALPNENTGFVYLQVVMDFSLSVPRIIVDGKECTVALISGNTMATWTPANFRSTRAMGVGGSFSGSFAADTALVYKNIHRMYFTDVVTAATRASIGEYMTS